MLRVLDPALGITILFFTKLLKFKFKNFILKFSIYLQNEDLGKLKQGDVSLIDFLDIKEHLSKITPWERFVRYKATVLLLFYMPTTIIERLKSKGVWHLLGNWVLTSFWENWTTARRRPVALPVGFTCNPLRGRQGNFPATNHPIGRRSWWGLCSSKPVSGN